MVDISRYLLRDDNNNKEKNTKKYFIIGSVITTTLLGVLFYPPADTVKPRIKSENRSEGIIFVDKNLLDKDPKEININGKKYIRDGTNTYYEEKSNISYIVDPNNGGLRTIW